MKPTFAWRRLILRSMPTGADDTNATASTAVRPRFPSITESSDQSELRTTRAAQSDELPGEATVSYSQALKFTNAERQCRSLSPVSSLANEFLVYVRDSNSLRPRSLFDVCLVQIKVV